MQSTEASGSPPRKSRQSAVSMRHSRVRSDAALAAMAMAGKLAHRDGTRSSGGRPIAVRQLGAWVVRVLSGRTGPAAVLAGLIVAGAGAIIVGRRPRRLPRPEGSLRPEKTETPEHPLQFLRPAQVLLDPFGEAGHQLGELRIAGEHVLEAAELAEEV